MRVTVIRIERVCALGHQADDIWEPGGFTPGGLCVGLLGLLPWMGPSNAGLPIPGRPTSTRLW